MCYIRLLGVIISVVLLLMGCGKGSTGRDLENLYLDYHKALQAEDVY